MLLRFQQDTERQEAADEEEKAEGGGGGGGNTGVVAQLGPAGPHSWTDGRRQIQQSGDQAAWKEQVSLPSLVSDQLQLLMFRHQRHGSPAEWDA